jgi:type I restriction-modification system DNA methylase subunit
MSSNDSLEKIDITNLAEEIRECASESSNEEELKIAVEKLLDPIVKSWRIRAFYEHKTRDDISGLREDALYGHVIIEYKKPGELESKTNFEKFKEKLKEYLTKEAKDQKNLGKWFGVITDGYKIAFIRFRKNKWEERGPYAINKETVKILLRAIRGLNLRIIEPEALVKDFGPGELSKRVIYQFYTTLIESKSRRTNMLFEDWKRVFQQVCAYSPEKLSALIEYYGLKDYKIQNVERLMFAIHTYYTLVMKFLTSEVISYFNPIFGSFLERVEGAYLKGIDEMKKELENLEEGGIITQLGIRNLLEADYFAWYLDEWDEKIAEAIFSIIEKLKEYDPGTLELYPEKVKDLFKRLYQNLVPKKVRHDLGEYFTPDWLAELLLDEIGYDGNPDKRILDPSCGSGTFLVLAINRIKDWAEREFYPDKKELLRKILQNVVGIDLNPLAVLAARANFILALGELNRLLPGENVDIPVYLADSILVSRKPTFYGEWEVYLKTSVGEFWIPHEVIDKKLLTKVLALIEDGIKGNYNKEEFIGLLKNKLKGLKSSSIDSLARLFMFIRKLEREGKNKIWTRLLKNSFAPLLLEKFDFVVGNPPWINWESLPEKYREDTKKLWDSYGLLERTEGAGLGKVKRDMAMLFTARCLDRYVKEKGKLAFLIPFTVYKTQAGAGFRKFLANGIENGERKIPCKVLKVHDLVTLYPFEGAINRTSLIVIEKDGKTEFPIPCVMWYNPRSKGIDQEAELEDVKRNTRQFELILAPIRKGKPETPWMIISEKTYRVLQEIIKPSDYKAYAGVYTGLNSAYWVKIRPISQNEVLVGNLYNIGKKSIQKLEIVTEKELIYPLVRGRDVKRWYSTPSLYIIVPHESKTGKPIKENILKVRYPKTYSYLFKIKKDLLNRQIHKLWGKDNPFYSLYDIGDYSFAPYKVCWKVVAGKISGKAEFSTSVIEPVKDDILGLKIPIPDIKLILIPFEERDEAYYVSAILNSSLAQLIVASYVIETGISTHVLEYIYIPKFNPNNKLHLKLSELSKKAHELAKRYYEQNDEYAKKELEKIEEEIDKTVAEIYGISDEELEEIKKTLKILKEGRVE